LCAFKTQIQYSNRNQINIPHKLVVVPDENQPIAPDPLLEDTESPKRPYTTRPPITTPIRFRVDKTSDVAATLFATLNPAPVNNNKNTNTSRALLGPCLLRYGRPIKPRQTFDL